MIKRWMNERMNEDQETRDIYENKKKKKMNTTTIIIDELYHVTEGFNVDVVYFNELRVRGNNKFMKNFIFLRRQGVKGISSMF